MNLPEVRGLRACEEHKRYEKAGVSLFAVRESCQPTSVFMSAASLLFLCVRFRGKGLGHWASILLSLTKRVGDCSLSSTSSQLLHGES